ncbi:response regulator [Azospirillum sp.]|uniref:response regulator n=1 Tax=Azospirillum sp. TaxID=34012 RepID=UPI003D759C2B
MKVLIAHSQALLREGARCLIEDGCHGAVVDEASSFEALLQCCADGKRYDAILLAARFLGMPGYDGLDTLRQIQPEARLIVLSDGNPEGADYVRAALEHGAHGYLPRMSGARVLVAALKLVLGGGIYIPPVLLEREALPDEAHAQAHRLTQRQHAILECLGKGQSAAMIAKRFDWPTSKVKIEISKLYKQMGVHSRTQAAIAAPSWR